MEHLTVDDDLVVYECRLLMPSEMNRQTIVHMNESHQGVVWTKQRVRLTAYRPVIHNDINNMIVACKHCQDHLPANQEKQFTSKVKPTRPFAGGSW